jgi:hypothetical protein
MTPAEWLTSVREKYSLVGNLALSAGWLDDFLGRLPESERKAAREVWNARRSISAAGVHDELMEQYLQQILPVLRADETRVAQSTFFGLLPTYQFNAFAGRTPRGDRIVILHHALVHTLSCWSHWYLRTKEEGGHGYLHRDPDGLIRALTYFATIWLGQSPSGPLPDIYPRTADSWRLHDSLVFSAISFIIGHELGHTLLGHSGYGVDRSWNHAMEFAADRSGLSVAIRHSLVKSVVNQGDTYHIKFALFGPLFALAVMSLVSDRSSNTHPSPSERRAALLSAYGTELRDILRDRFDEFLDAADRDVLDVFGRNSDGLFRLFAVYREVIDEMKVLMRRPLAPWLDNELAGLWSYAIPDSE